VSGDSETGGGGSVKWKLKADNVDQAGHQHNGKKVDQDGTDEDGAAGTDLTVSVQVPQGMTGDAFLDHLKSILRLTPDKKRVYFNHPIERNEHKQIRVSWGANNPNHLGNGGKPTLSPPAPGTGTRTQA
jgi:hypothetical protein